MRFDFLTSSYLQYKADTDAVATWLVATARRCGFPVDTLGGGTTATSTPATKSQAHENILALRDFISLADYIAASTNPVITVPTTFVTVLERAISVRRDHGAQATEKLPPGPELKDSSNRHNHFIGILEHVWQALRPRMSSDNVKDPLTQRIDDVSANTKASNLANRFEGLNIQEPSEAFLQAPNVTIPLPSDGEPEVDYEAERLHDMEEAYFAFDLLVQDLRKMQNVIKHTWKGYRLGLFDLVSASLMTNTAIDFARHMEEEIQPLLNAHGGLVFACQLLLDIHHTLREDVEKGFNDLTTAARVIENSINMNLKFHADLRVETWPKQKDMVLHLLFQHISWWTKFDFTQKSKQKLGVWRPAEMKWHPLLCGIWTYNVKARFQDIAITFSNAWGSIMYSAHLYNALRQEKLLSKKLWPDMEVVLWWHDEIFVGDPPSKPADYLKRYSLSMGYSRSIFC